MNWTRHWARLALAVIVLALAACGRPGPSAGEPAAERASAPKRLTTAIMSDLKALGAEGGAVPGKGTVQGLLQAGLANLDEQDALRAQLAESVPSLENGLWRLSPDGRMETTWNIRPNARWHDGMPFTSDDVLFTAQVHQDRELPAFRDVAYQSVEAVEAPDPLTVLVRWKEPYINADRLFGNPLPRRLLEGPAREEKLTFTQLPYWSQEFVGTGPFRLREWARGSHILVQANDDYALGRPKIDEIEIKLIPDSNTLMSNILAGVVELPLGRTLSLEQALQVRDRWPQGQIEIVPRIWNVIYPQFTYTNPPVVGDARFRRALLHAIDRQELVDTLVSGYSSVAHSILPPDRPEYAELKARAPRYDYDPRKATQMIEELGYARGADGAFQDRGGQRLEVEIRTTGDNEIHLKTLYPVVDYWKRIGLDADPVVIPPQRQADREYRATFPAFEMLRNPNDAGWVANFHSSRVKTRENNWTGSYTAYHSPGYDALHERYARTIPMKERLELLGQIVHHLAEQAVVMGLFYDTLAVLRGNRVANVIVPKSEGAEQVWSAYLWEFR